jgi:hypothetical protein
MVPNSNDLEVVKAVAEGSAAGATRALQTLMIDLLGGAAKEAGAELTLTVQEWRARRGLRLGRRVVQKITGRPTRPIPPNVLVPAFDYATLEDREELLNMWVELLATAATDSAPVVDRLHVEILRDVTPVDARVLQHLRNTPPEHDKNDPRFIVENNYNGPPPIVRPRLSKETIMRALSISEPDFELAASRLARLGLCEAGRFLFPTRLGSSATGPRVYDSLVLTPIGVAFVFACSPAKDEN